MPALTGLRRRGECVRVQTTGLVLIMVLLLGCGLLTVGHVTETIDEMISRTAEARLRGTAAQTVLVALQDSESGQRGYLLTGRPAYLEPYHATINRIEELLEVLRQRVADDPAMTDAYDRLATSARGKVLELRRTVDLAQRDGAGAAGTVTLSNEGEQFMRTARAAAVEIITQAERERASFARALNRTQQVVTDILLGALVAAVVLLGAVALVLVWSKDRLHRARDGERQQAARVQAAIEHVPGGVGVFDEAGLLRLSNSRFAAALAVPPAMAVPGVALAPIAAAAALDPPLLPARPTAPTATEVRQAGRTLEVWRSPMPDGGQMLSVTDVTRRVQAEEVGRQAQKMDVLGQMTGGVAHDFNNLLQIVTANLELVRSRVTRLLPGDAALVARIDAASAGAVRGARLTRHLLAFARRQPLAPEPLDPARLLQGMDDVLRRTLREAVQLEVRLGTGLWTMRADPTQFENALLNLALNARDAMEDTEGIASGHLVIEAANAVLDEVDAGQASSVRPGQYVMFAVTDSGTGMTPEQIIRATEPFYTTKAEGRGTGLGLSMVSGFAKQSGGHFQLHSEPGQGTTARLYIPRTTAPLPQAPPDPAGDSGQDPAPMGDGALVMLVEDDAAVRQAAQVTLESLGYAVVEAENADAALVLLESGIRPRVLFTDVVMPGVLSAKALAERARLLDPEIAVLFTSGYTRNGIVKDGQLAAGITLLSKPWQTKELAAALRQVIAGERAAAPPLRRVLLVEDEELVRMTTADVLAELGFDVVQAGTAAGALARLEPPPDLVITDLGLPDGDGGALVMEIRRHLPAMPVIIASGNSGLPDNRTDAGAAAGADDARGPEVVWLPKPYDIQALRRAVAAAMGG